jgi:hypothetical protein
MTKPHDIDKDFDKNQKTFEQQPIKTKELQILKDESEKTTGTASLPLQKLIQDKSKTAILSQSDLLP